MPLVMILCSRARSTLNARRTAVGSRRQSQPPSAPCRGVDAALDEAERLKPVDQARDRHRRDFRDRGEFVLGQVGLALEAREVDRLVLRAPAPLRDLMA